MSVPPHSNDEIARLRHAESLSLYQVADLIEALGQQAKVIREREERISHSRHQIETLKNEKLGLNKRITRYQNDDVFKANDFDSLSRENAELKEAVQRLHNKNLQLKRELAEVLKALAEDDGWTDTPVIGRRRKGQHH
jgi:uncharacterized coiled-coil DUF342 family protein